MADLQHPWGAYMRLQETLSHRTQVDDLAWGLEAGLNRIIDSSSIEYPSHTDIDRAVTNGARQDRYRTQLRTLHLDDIEPDDPSTNISVIEARQTLQLVKEAVDHSDWILLCNVAVGHEYAELAAVQQETAPHLRVRVLRLRRSLMALAA